MRPAAARLAEARNCRQGIAKSPFTVMVVLDDCCAETMSCIGHQAVQGRQASSAGESLCSLAR
jgi:hypothetical protein